MNETLPPVTPAPAAAAPPIPPPPSLAPPRSRWHAVDEMLSGPRFGTWMRNLAIGGAVLGALLGLGRGLVAHAPGSTMGVLVLRFAIAGAAAGASLLPTLRAGSFVLKGFLWFALSIALWWIMMVAGDTRWLGH